MPTGGTLFVRVSQAIIEPRHSDHRTWVSVEFIDTGCGMRDEQLVQIFQPFFTTKRAGRGTGLGLASALETIRAHGGQIKVDSRSRGKGLGLRSCFQPMEDRADAATISRDGGG